MERGHTLSINVTVSKAIGGGAVEKRTSGILTRAPGQGAAGLGAQRGGTFLSLLFLLTRLNFDSTDIYAWRHS